MSSKNISPIDIIDTVLKTINQTSVSNATSKELIFNTPFLSQISELDRQVILEKLLADKYISVKTASDLPFDAFPKGIPLYRITFEGVLFIHNGCYKVERRNKRISKAWQIISSVFLVLAAIIASIYYIHSFLTPTP